MLPWSNPVYFVIKLTGLISVHYMYEHKKFCSLGFGMIHTEVWSDDD